MTINNSDTLTSGLKITKVGAKLCQTLKISQNFTKLPKWQDLVTLHVTSFVLRPKVHTASPAALPTPPAVRLAEADCY